MPTLEAAMEVLSSKFWRFMRRHSRFFDFSKIVKLHDLGKKWSLKPICFINNNRKANE
jgi:hypothetical protein